MRSFSLLSAVGDVFLDSVVHPRLLSASFLFHYSPRRLLSVFIVCSAQCLLNSLYDALVHVTPEINQRSCIAFTEVEERYRDLRPVNISDQ